MYKLLMLILLTHTPLALAATDSHGNEGNFVGGGSGLKIEPGQTALICQPSLLAAAANAGIGNGSECIRFSNNGTNSTNNYLPIGGVSSFLSFAQYFASGKDSKEACQVASNPWGGWQGEPTTDCGIHPFEQTRTCSASAAYCDDTCPTPPTETRLLSVDNGECETCNSDIYLAPDGSHWEVFAAQCPTGESFMSTNCVGDKERRPCDGPAVCDADSFSNYQSNVIEAYPNSESYFHWVNDCGEYKTQYVRDVTQTCTVTMVDVVCTPLPVGQQIHINTITYPAPKPAACPVGSTSCYQY